MGMSFRGVDRFHSSLFSMSAKARAYTREAVEQGAIAIQHEIVDNLMRKEHPKGTRTPSSPGEPPAMITGALKASVYVSGTRSRVGATQFEAKVGPSTKYARIQELGGVAGRGSHLPARPYVKPALHTLVRNHKLLAIFRTFWSRAHRR